MLIDQDKWYHAGNVWQYQDARGVQHVGHLQSVSDFGGTDVPYTFRDCQTGQLSVVSGSNLKSAHPSYSHTCEIRTAIIAECDRSAS